MTRRWLLWADTSENNCFIGFGRFLTGPTRAALVSSRNREPKDWAHSERRCRLYWLGRFLRLRSVRVSSWHGGRWALHGSQRR